MAYLVDLTIILQAVFQVSLQNDEGRVTQEHVNEVIYEFYFSEKKNRIHSTIRLFEPSFTMDDVDKIEWLIKNNEV